MTPIDIRPADLEAVRLILRDHVPAVEVRAFGSRVAWNARETSDLDLALMTDEPLTVAQMADLRAAFTESDLPFRVDLVDWASASDDFRKVIAREHVAIAAGGTAPEPVRWRETTLDQLGRIVTGRTPPSGQPEYFGGHIPFVTPSDFDGRRRIDTPKRYLTSAGADIVKRVLVPAEAVMVSCIGSDMGKTALASCDSVTNQQINSLLCDSGTCALFVYYNLRARRAEIRGTASGSAQPILTPILLL